ncbi:MAG: hypothetical protein ABI240_08905 [Sphingomonas sp.]
MTIPGKPLFPPLDATDTVVRESMALVQRYRLMRMLEDKRGIRRDLRGDAPDPALAAEMARQLVPGIDAPLHGGTIDWPIRAGVRLEVLGFSPWLADVEDKRLHGLPKTAVEFAELFEAKTGIAPDCDAMDRNYRVTPAELAVIAENVRGPADKPSVAYLLLCSRHFDAAVAAAPMLGKSRAKMRFDRPPIDGFKLLAELEREALMVEELAWLNLLSAREIRKWLDGKPKTLVKKLRQYPQLKRLFDYAMIGSDAIGGFDNADRGSPSAGDLGYLPSDPNLRVVAAAKGKVDADVVAALTVNGELARVTLRAAFPDPETGTRSNPLSNDEPATFYGVNSMLAGAMQADLGRGFRHGDINNADGADIERQALLADAIIARADPQLHAGNVSRTANRTKGEASGTNRQRNAQAYGALMLPKLGVYGSAPRATIDLWDEQRWGDAPFWAVFLDRRLGSLALSLSSVERGEIIGAFERLEALFQRTFDIGTDIVTAQAREDALCAICDMASAISAISINRHFPRAILGWLAVFNVARANKTVAKEHGARWLPAGEHVLKVRARKGSPPVGKRRAGALRNRRASTRKLNALRARRMRDDS